MDIRAIIMAGGEGVRLRPLTMYLPKPLVPVMGKPLMSYAMQLLKRHGVEDVGVTLWYQPKKVRAAFGRGEKEKMRLQYFEETEPLGTAGSIKLAEDKIKDTFFVLSGDGLTDCDLTKAMAFHKEKKALATLVLKRVSVPLPYGVVMTEEDGRIIRFVEKPDWSGVYSNLVNTGIYILEREVLDFIDDHEAVDFGKDLFPLLLKNKERLYGYEMEGYWCDVGNTGAYLEAQMDMLKGKVKLDFESGVHPDAVIEENVHLQGKFYIGKGTVIGRGSIIKNAVIGEQCRIGKGTVMEDSCIWDKASVGIKARMNGSILCDGASVGSLCQLSAGCVLGKGAAAGAHSILMPGVKIWPGQRIPAGAVCGENVETGNNHLCVWDEEGAACEKPGTACRLVQAYVKALHPRKVICGHLAAPGQQAVVAGTLCCSGVQVIQGGFMTQGILQEMVHALKADGGVLATEDHLIFLDGDGREIDNDKRRKMEGLILAGEGHIISAVQGGITDFDGAEALYLAHVMQGEKEKSLFSPVAVFCKEKALLLLAAEGLKEMNARQVRIVHGERGPLRENETGFVLAEDGKSLIVFDEKGEIEKTQLDMLRLKLITDKMGCLYDMPDVPRAAGGWMDFCEMDKSENCFRQEQAMGDGLAALFLICESMKEGSIWEKMTDLPPVYVVCRDVDCRENEKGRILYDLCRTANVPYTLKRGMQAKHETGYATVVPNQHRPSVRIFSEASNMEAANELCDFYDREIKRTLQKNTEI